MGRHGLYPISAYCRNHSGEFHCRRIRRINRKNAATSMYASGMQYAIHGMLGHYGMPKLLIAMCRANSDRLRL